MPSVQLSIQLRGISASASQRLTQNQYTKKINDMIMVATIGAQNCNMGLAEYKCKV